MEGGSLQDFPFPSKSKKQQKTGEELIEAEPGQTEYGIVLKPFGDRRFLVKLVSTGKLLECRLAGKIPRGRDNRIEEGDYVLVEIRIDESDTDMHKRRGTIVLKYTLKEINKLQKKGELIERRSSQLQELFVDFVDSEPTKGGKAIFYEWDLPPSSSDSEDDD